MISEGKVVFEGATAKGLNVLLRYPQPGDAPALLDYINFMSREQTYILFQGEQLTLEDELHYLDARLAAIRVGSGVQVLAFSDGALAGNAGIEIKWGTNRHVGELGISVAQAFRGQGVGELLMNTVINEAITHLEPLKLITLEVFGNNVAAINLYQKVGFIEFGRLPGGRLHRGQYVDNVYMYKPVREL
jgi:RimJ/RimL family protein N-acetyltransferase